MAAASITGVFTILDRASGPMRKMEAQAAKTMAAIEGVGAALDAAGGGSGGNSFARNAEKMARGLQDIDRSGTQASKALAGMGDAMKKSDKDGKGFLATMQKLRDVAGGLSAVITGLKWSVLATGIGLAVQAVGALSAGVIALIPRLTDLVGVLAAAPAAVGTFAQSMGTLMFALKPAFAAITAGFQKAAKSTDPFEAAMARLGPSGQRFVKQVIALRPAFDSLSRAAGARLFPELSKSLRDVEKLFPMLRRNLTATGGALGQSISGLTGDLTTPQRMSDLNKIMQSQTRLAGYAGQAFRNLANALVDFMVAARPFSEWLGRTLTGWTRYIANAAKAGRETGGIARYLDRTKSSMQLFGNMLKNVWEIMTALGAAARPLGDRLWGGANRALEGWAAFLNSAEGATEARKWFDSMYEPLHAMGQLIKTAAVEIFGMTKNTDSLTSTLNSLQGALPALAEFFTNAASLGPGIGRALTSIAEILNALPWAPTKLLIEGLAGMLEVVNQLVKAFPPLAWALSLYLTYSAGSKMIAAIGMVRSLAAAWMQVGAAQASANAGGMGGAIGRSAGKPVAPFISGATRGGVGLGIGLGGGLAASAAGAAIGGDTGAKVSGIGGMAAAGAGIGMLAGPWGALAGGLAGAVAGAISTGLFKGADRAKEAGKKAGEDYIKGLGMAGINPATGQPYPKGQNPFGPIAGQVDAAQAAIAGARNNLPNGRGRVAGRAGYIPGQQATPEQIRAFMAVQREQAPTIARGITQPLSGQGMFLRQTSGVVSQFQTQFANLPKTAQIVGAKTVIEWARGMEKNGQAVKGYTTRLVGELVQRFGTLRERWGATGRQAMERFEADARKSKAVGRVTKLGNELITNLFQGKGASRMKIDSSNWERVIGDRIRQLRTAANDASGSRRKSLLADIKQLEKYADKARSAKRAADRLNEPPAARGRKREFGEIVGRGAYGRGPAGKDIVPKTIDAPKIKPLDTAPIRKGLERVRTATGQTTKAFGRLPGASKTASNQVSSNARQMASTYNVALTSMRTATNSLLSGLGAEKISVGGQETGGRLTAGGQVFAAGGRIPGRPRGDHIPLVGRGGSLLGIADGGELVVNRHTEKRVNGMLASHGTSLGREVAGEKRPHWKSGPGFATGGRVNAPTMTGASNPLSMGAQRAANAMFERVAQAANKKVEREQEKVMAAAGGAGSTKGLVAQVLRALAFARANGWAGSVTSGWRSRAEQAVLYQRWLAGTGNRAAPPGQSNHESGQAVDVTDTEGFARAMAKAPANSKLLRGVPGEPWHFSVTGAALGARLPRFGGWHARGMHGMVDRPTLIGVGERGPERVKVTPAGKSSGGKTGGIEVHIGNINYSRKGDVAKAIREEMELLSDELAQMGDNE